MERKENLKSFGELMKNRVVKKAPAYQWQDLALRVINELNIPNNKRSSVFRVCKQNTKQIVERAMNDTKELCKTGEKWRYFFKIIDNWIGNRVAPEVEIEGLDISEMGAVSYPDFALTPESRSAARATQANSFRAAS